MSKVLTTDTEAFFFPEVKRPGREGDNSPPSNAEVKNKWSFTSTPPYALMACTGTTLPLKSRPNVLV
jgi:hypothetical protein